MEAETSLWRRSRQAAYAEIRGVAIRLFVAHGFDQTTIEQIAVAAGISRRSFFRYFGTKEDVVVGNLAEQGAVVQAALESVPQSVGPWEALRFALGAVDVLEVQPEDTLAVAKMIYETPSLRARSIEKHLQWQVLLTPNIRTRLNTGADHTDPAAGAIVASALACLDVAGEIWSRGGGTDLAALYDRAVQTVRTPTRRHFPDQSNNPNNFNVH